MMKIRLRAAAALFLVFVLGSCSGDSTLSGDEGVFSFRYSGAASGEFSATTAVRGILFGQLSPFNAGGGYVLDGTLYEAGVSAPSDLEGKYEFSSDRFSLVNAYGAFVIRPPGQVSPEPYVFVSGTLEVTRATGERLRGRFSGTARRGGETIQITDGRFDLAVGLVGSGD